jgi:AraC-like DNA-binding protein
MTIADRKNASSGVNEVGAPRGVLKRSESPNGSFHHSRLAPPSSIAALVQHIWIVRWRMDAGESHVAQTLPYPTVHIVVEDGTTQVHGVHHGRFSRKLQGAGAAIGIKFRAGGFRPFLGRSVSTLRDRAVPLESVLGASVCAFTHALSIPDVTDTEAVAAIEKFLLQHWPDHDPDVDRAASIVAAIESDRTLLRVEDLVARYELTKRSLQRFFEQYVGIGPKWVINRFRMHEAIDRLNHREPVDWAAFALELGYFDQAHFNRDFKALIGCTPKRYVVDSQSLASS